MKPPAPADQISFADPARQSMPNFSPVRIISRHRATRLARVSGRLALMIHQANIFFWEVETRPRFAFARASPCKEFLGAAAESWVLFREFRRAAIIE